MKTLIPFLYSKNENKIIERLFIDSIVFSTSNTLVTIMILDDDDNFEYKDIEIGESNDYFLILEQGTDRFDLHDREIVNSDIISGTIGGELSFNHGIVRYNTIDSCFEVIVNKIPVAMSKIDDIVVIQNNNILIIDSIIEKRLNNEVT